MAWNLDARLEPPNLVSAGLKRFRGALGEAETKPCDIVVIGDSLSEGYSASSDTARWTNLLTKNLQELYNPVGVPGGEGYIAVHHTVDPAAAAGNLPNRWTYTGFGATPTNAVFGSGFGLGYRHISFGAGQSMTITVYGDRFWAWFVRGSGAGVASITVDGNTLGNYNGVTGTLDTGYFDTGILPRGFHTITIGYVSGQPYFCGLTVFDGEGGPDYTNGKGVRMYEAATYGSTTGGWLGTYSLFQLGQIRPDLVMVGLIANDITSGTALADYESNLNTIVDNVRWFSGVNVGATPPSVLLWAPPKTNAVADQAVWDSYVERIKKVASGKGCAFVSLDRVLPSVQVTPGLYAADNLHYSDAGERELARALTRALVGGDSFNKPKIDNLTSRLERQELKGSLSYGHNLGGTGSLVISTSGTVEVPNCLITVPPCDSDVWLECECLFQQSTLGFGDVYLFIYETTGLAQGSYGTVVATFTSALPNQNTSTGKFVTCYGKIRLGPTTTYRSFKLAAQSNISGVTGIFSATFPAFLGAYAQ